MEIKSKKLYNWFLMKPKVAGLILLLFMLMFIFLIVNQRYDIFKEKKEKEMANILINVEDKIAQSLKNSKTIALTLSLAKDGLDVPKHMDHIVNQMMQSNPELIAMQIVADGLVKYSYPKKENKTVVNFDFFKNAYQIESQVKKNSTIDIMYYQGPVALKDVGEVIIGGLPIYIDGKFFGFSIVVIKLETFLKNVGIDNSRYEDYHFQFSQVNTLTHKEEVYLPMPKNFSTAEFKQINFPNVSWKIYLANAKYYDTWLVLITAITFGIGSVVLSSYLLTKLLKKQGQLQHTVYVQASKLFDVERQYKKLFYHSAIGIATVNAITGQILEVNRYLCDFLNYTEEELLTRNIKSFLHPNEVGDDGVLLKHLLAGKIREFHKIKRYINKNGNTIWGSVIITPLWQEGDDPSNYIIIIENITKRKEEEQILISSQHKMETLINTIDGVVWEGQPESDTFTFVSEKIKDILGYTPKQWMTIPNFWIDHIHPEDQEWVKDYRDRLTLEKKNRDFEYRMIAKDDSIVWIRDMVRVIVEEDQPVKLRGIMIDITTKVEATDALNKSFNMVIEQNKRLQNFSYIVSHNLRSHASNILGINALIESAQTEDDRNEMIQLLKKVSGNLNETLLNLNNIVNIQTSVNIVVEPINLREYIENTLSSQNVQILLKKATIVNNVEETILVNFNRAYLESILLNLVSNALRYSSPNREPIISISSVNENDQMVLSIVDNGVGIDLNKHGDKIFGIYQTFNGNADARGFGLFISKNQIESMGGRIEVESILNEGTTFKIYFKKIESDC